MGRVLRVDIFTRGINGATVLAARVNFEPSNVEGWSKVIAAETAMGYNVVCYTCDLDPNAPDFDARIRGNA